MSHFGDMPQDPQDAAKEARIDGVGITEEQAADWHDGKCDSNMVKIKNIADLRDALILLIPVDQMDFSDFIPAPAATAAPTAETKAAGASPSKRAYNDGGPAFPMPGYISPSGLFEWPISGMTLLDHFAAIALTGILSSPHTVVTSTNGAPGETLRAVTAKLSEVAYLYADAMLAERERRAK